jgi:NAD(P)H-hydrate epimerase
MSIRHFPASQLDLPAISTEQMVEVDRLMVEQYRIDLIQMMENAGRCLALVARDRFLGGNPGGKSVLVLAGTGGNGGGALVAARRLASWGASVQIGLTKTDQMTKIPAHQ